VVQHGGNSVQVVSALAGAAAGAGAVAAGGASEAGAGAGAAGVEPPRGAVLRAGV
jgi:hypothetical protein